MSDKRLLLSGNNGNQIATHSPCGLCGINKLCVVFLLCVASCSPISHVGGERVSHRVPQFSIAFPHPPIHNTIDKPMGNLWSVVFLLGEVATEKGQGSPTRGVERVLGGGDIAPDLTNY